MSFRNRLSLGSRPRFVSRARRGFTLVELLVVISIIGMLMALLLPAVQQARESGRQNTCRNNQRQLALAMTQKELALKRYPGYVEMVGEDANGRPTVKPWGFVLLPFLEHNDYYERYVNNNNQITQTLEVMQCPSDPPDGSNLLPHSSFGLNSGRQDQVPTNAPMGTLWPLDWKDNGIFHNVLPRTMNRVPGSGVVDRAVVHMNSSYLTARDGNQNTIMLAENSDISSWVLGDADNTDGQWDLPLITASEELGFERQLCVIWNGVWNTTTLRLDPTPLTMKMNVGVGTDPTGNDFGFARPSAIHPTGCNITFADTHTKFMSQDTDYTIFAQLYSSSNRAVLDPNTTTVSTTMAAMRTLILDEKEIP